MFSPCCALSHRRTDSAEVLVENHRLGDFLGRSAGRSVLASASLSARCCQNAEHRRRVFQLLQPRESGAIPSWTFNLAISSRI
jgi:hypothetical protein